MKIEIKPDGTTHIETNGSPPGEIAALKQGFAVRVGRGKYRAVTE